MSPSENIGKQEISLLKLASIIIRSRRAILILGITGGLLGLVVGLTQQRMYRSSATFLPEAGENSTSGLAIAASQFGLRLPTNSSAWSLPVYVEILKSREVLEPIARDSFTVSELGGERIPLMDLLEIQAPTPAEKLDRTLETLSAIIETQERTTLGAVSFSVTTRWPSVSHQLAEKLIAGINAFNLRARRTQATEERRFVEEQAAKAEQELRLAENRLQGFLQRNRAIDGSPELQFEYDRLQRQVALRQQVYTTLLQSREDARIREVRDVAVVTVLQQPRVPVRPEPRRSVLKAVVGGLIGGTVGIAFALMQRVASRVRRASSPDAHEFFAALREAKPRLSFRR